MVDNICSLSIDGLNVWNILQTISIPYVSELSSKNYAK